MKNTLQYFNTTAKPEKPQAQEKKKKVQFEVSQTTENSLMTNTEQSEPQKSLEEGSEIEIDDQLKSFR